MHHVGVVSRTWEPPQLLGQLGSVRVGEAAVCAVYREAAELAGQAAPGCDDQRNQILR